MTKIKLCGMQRPQDIDLANALSPDYVGFVFANGRRRCISEETAALFRSRLSPAITPVGVFVDNDLQTVARLLGKHIISVVQLHGHEDEAYINRLRTLTDRPIIQVFRIESESDIEKARNSSADLVTLDSGIGGTGTAFDWSLIRDFGRPFILAGGLTAENVREAILRLRPYGVDVSSGIERDGVKDREKAESFIRAVRVTNRQG